AWTPDSKNLIFYAKGKLWNLEVLTEYISDIPFEVTVNQVITEALHNENRVFSDDFDVKMIRQLTTSSDSISTIAFHGAGYIYTKILPDEDPVRITEGTDFEYEPEFSPDGKFLVYVSWSDENRGSIWKK